MPPGLVFPPPTLVPSQPLSQTQAGQLPARFDRIGIGLSGQLQLLGLISLVAIDRDAARRV